MISQSFETFDLVLRVSTLLLFLTPCNIQRCNEQKTYFIACIIEINGFLCSLLGENKSIFQKQHKSNHKTAYKGKCKSRFRNSSICAFYWL